MNEDRAAETERLLREAMDLLRDARFGLNDPGQARTWGQRKRRLRDAVTALDYDESA